ncbi:TlpA family protein disulfide reductase [Paenibacillus fonticola]|uniref:TlpA family protein disulfide reductase n=1 Tax=Paenibacillus fonticola TaxID=379896 RepID=UPI000375F7EC|nr:TlpA disulfide reductase family protein [Paenibacillus fonticola]
MRRKNLWILVAMLILLGIALYQNSGSDLLSLGLGGKEPATGQKEVKTLGTAVAEKAPKPGSLSPSFALPGMDGQTYKVGGERDKPVLVNFWASWCDPCKDEAPDLVKMYEKYGDKLDIYGVNVTAYDTVEQAEAFVQEYGIKFPVLLDKKEEAYKLFNGIAFPTNVLIDQNGVIQDVVVGILPPKDLEAKVKKLLNS